MVTTKERYTLLDLLELPDDGVIYDILGGELVVRNVPDDNHAEVLNEMNDFLFAAQHAGYGRVYVSGRGVALDYPIHSEAAQDVTRPDLFFVRSGRETLRGRHALQGVPDLVVEILSPSTRSEHLPGGRLWQTYERHGVPAYWLADPAPRTLWLYTLVGEPYVRGHYVEPVTLRPGDLLSTPLFPGITVPVATLFARVRAHDRERQPPERPHGQRVDRGREDDDRSR